MDIPADSKLSVNKAAALWGVSTSTIYKALDSGTLGRSGDGKLIASEMMRVFGRINGEDSASLTTKPKSTRTKKVAAAVAPSPRQPRTQKTGNAKTAADTPTAVAAPVTTIVAKQAPPAPQLAPALGIAPQLEQQLRQQIAMLEQQLVEAKAREDWLKAQINELWTEKVELQNAKKGVLGRLLG